MRMYFIMLEKGLFLETYNFYKTTHFYRLNCPFDRLRRYLEEKCRFLRTLLRRIQDA